MNEATKLRNKIIKEGEKPTVWRDLLEPIALANTATTNAAALAKSCLAALKESPELNAKYNGLVGGLVKSISDTGAEIKTAHEAAKDRLDAEVTANEYPDFLAYSSNISVELEQLSAQVEAVAPIFD